MGDWYVKIREKIEIDVDGKSIGERHEERERHGEKKVD